MASKAIFSGIERVLANPELIQNLGRIALVSNQSCYADLNGVINSLHLVISDAHIERLKVLHEGVGGLLPVVDAVKWAVDFCVGSKVVKVFGPQHGYYQTEQDNMIETKSSSYAFNLAGDGEVVPLLSLYDEGEKGREPSNAQCDDIDTFVVDMPDIGVRVYTYMLTFAGILRIASKLNKRVVLLDRANPLGLFHKREDGTYGGIEGNILDTRWNSFVGWYPIPFVHGLTMAELGNLFVRHDSLSVDYRVVKVLGLSREDGNFGPAEFNLAPPSPNMSNERTHSFFPAFVVLEATNMSEGRGTTMPFCLVGAPWFDSAKFIQYISKTKLNNVSCLPLSFTPTFSKHKDVACRGVLFNKMNDLPSSMFSLGIHFLYFCCAHHSEFKWRTLEEGYEYNFRDPAYLLILGSDKWKKLFDFVLENGMCEKSDVLLNETLQWANKEAQNFATSVYGIDTLY